MKEFEFPWSSEAKGYQLFPGEMENDPLVLFHATPKRNLRSVLATGFKAFPPLSSVSYAKSSVYCLSHLFVHASVLGEEAVVIAVRFTSLQQDGIVVDTSDIHVYKPEIQPEILGYCTVPTTYKHV